MNDERLKTLLHELSGEMRPDPALETRTLRRAKRRRALNASVAGIVAVVLVIGVVGGVRLLAPSEALLPGTDVGGGWFYAGTLQHIEREGVVYLPAQKVFVVDTVGAPIALSAISPHQGNGEGERVLYCPSSGWFMEQFHGGQFDGLGYYQLGPGPRGLDRVALRVTDSGVEVNPAQITLGPARLEQGGGEPPVGAFCGDGGELVEGRPGFALASGDPGPGELPAIVVDTPADGDRVSSPVRISGVADVFEANVRIRILDAVNNAVADTFTTASCGSGCRGTFSTEVEFSVGSAQSGVIQVLEENVADEGPRFLNKVEIPVTLLPSPPDPSEPDVVGAWQDAAGEPTYTHDGNGTSLRLHVFRGADHCGWTSALFLTLAWPLGTTADSSQGTRQYVRDPQGLFVEGLLRGLPDLDAGLPGDAVDTGFQRGDWELWVSPTDDHEAVYLVSPDRIERWSRSVRPILCA